MKYFLLFLCSVCFFTQLNCRAGNQTSLVESGQIQNKNSSPAGAQTVYLYDLAEKPVRATRAAYREQSRMGKDNSTVETMYDSYGSKTESRLFYNDALLKMVVLRTAADGQTEALVFGQNGEVKGAPPAVTEKILTSPAGEIAKTVGIFEGRRAPEMPPTPQLAQTSQPYDFSAATAQIVEKNADEKLPIDENKNVIEKTAASGQTPTNKSEPEAKPESTPSKSGTIKLEQLSLAKNSANQR